ncbi:MAG: SRPBCC family protein [Solirubrobacterales bacterium]
MAEVTRTRELDVAPEEVWKLVADPYNLPRWWPETVRVESVDGQPGTRRSRFTQVLETAKGKPVRADYRCTQATRPQRLVWSQDVAGTPFEQFLREAGLAFELEPRAEGTRVSLTGSRTLRGLSRLGSPMMRQATKRTLDRALDGIAVALGTD